MRLTIAATAVVAVLSGLAGAAQAQVPPAGRRMPPRVVDTTAARGTPAMGTVGAAGTPATGTSLSDAQQRETTLKAQRASEARDKAWDAKMKRTMSSICGGC